MRLNTKIAIALSLAAAFSVQTSAMDNIDWASMSKDLDFQLEQTRRSDRKKYRDDKYGELLYNIENKETLKETEENKMMFINSKNVYFNYYVRLTENPYKVDPNAKNYNEDMAMDIYQPAPLMMNVQKNNVNLGNDTNNYWNYDVYMNGKQLTK